MFHILNQIKDLKLKQRFISLMFIFSEVKDIFNSELSNEKIDLIFNKLLTTGPVFIKLFQLIGNRQKNFIDNDHIKNKIGKFSHKSVAVIIVVIYNL